MQTSITKITNVVLFTMISGWAMSISDNSEIDRCIDHDVTYTVQVGDNLYKISAQFGSYLFWESIYVANADKVSNPDLIYPGQRIRIPYNVASYQKRDVALDSVLDNPFCNVSELPFAQVQVRFTNRYDLAYLESKVNAEQGQEKVELREQEMKREKESVSDVDKGAAIEAFREAFDAVVQDNDKGKKTENSEEKAQRESERQLMLEIDGMVHDETRSKVGRDFYDVFYSYWQSPAQASNFTIRVAEQPSPNLGTTIYVTVNQTETFRMRLQPRYEMIQEAGKYAVRQTYSHLQNNTQNYIIY